MAHDATTDNRYGRAIAEFVSNLKYGLDKLGDATHIATLLPASR